VTVDGFEQPFHTFVV